MKTAEAEMERGLMALRLEVDASIVETLRAMFAAAMAEAHAAGRAAGLEEAMRAVEETPVVEGRGYDTLGRAIERLAALSPPAQPVTKEEP